MKQALLLLVVLFLETFPLLGQIARTSKEVLEERKKSVYSHRQDSHVASILTGRRYTESINQFKQYFLGKYITTGSLVFDGVLFENIELQYNLHTQQVVALLETESVERYVTVTPDKVFRFSVYGHEFIQYPGDNVMDQGIYEMAYRGEKSTVFIKRTSIEKETIRSGTVNVRYEPINKYYVKNEFGTFHITGKKKLIEAYGNSASLISIIKNHELKFTKKKVEKDLVTAIIQLENRAGPSNL